MAFSLKTGARLVLLGGFCIHHNGYQEWVKNSVNICKVPVADLVLFLGTVGRGICPEFIVSLA